MESDIAGTNLEGLVGVSTIIKPGTLRD